MTVFHLHSSNQLNSLPLTELPKDWFDQAINAPPRYAFGIDETHLHFRATRHAKPTVHPSAMPGVFQAELWKFDVAEFFLRNPDTGTYLEINLAPNGAWWSCLFTAPLKRLSNREEPIPNLTATASHSTQEWDARISVPLEYLHKTLDFSPASQLHAAFLLDSPQHCLTTGSPPPGEPNFHHPDLPTAIRYQSPNS